MIYSIVIEFYSYGYKNHLLLLIKLLAINANIVYNL